MLGGEKDIAYNNGMDDFKRINHVPVFVANMDVGHGGTYRSLMVVNLPGLLQRGFNGNWKAIKKLENYLQVSQADLAGNANWKVERKIFLAVLQ